MSTRYVDYWLADGHLQRESAAPLDPADLDPAWRSQMVCNQSVPWAAGQEWDALARAYVTPAVVKPVPVMTVSGTVFLRDRLTLPVVAAAMAASDTDPMLRAFILLVQKTEPIDLADASTQQGVGYLAQKGLIAASDMARILAPAGV